MSEIKDDTKKAKYTPILPFDITIGEDFEMYQNFTYRRDLSLFDNDEQKMERGNVIHGYRCNFQEARPIGGDAPAAEEESSEEESNEED